MVGSWWAGEALLANPTSLAFDEQGRLFVTETHRLRTSALDLRDYPDLLLRDAASKTIEDHANLLQSAFGEQISGLGVESERVRLVEDSDGDGKADRSGIVAENLNQPTGGIAGGLLVQRDHVWLAMSPSVWKIPRRSSTAGSVKPEEVLRGFGVHVGQPDHGVNSLVRGPDGMIYVAMGDRGAHLVRSDGTSLSVPESGAVVKFHPDGSGLEVVATGLRNPSDLAFDAWGNLFATDRGGGEGERGLLVQIIDGSDHGWHVGYSAGSLPQANPWMAAADDSQPAFARDRPALALPPVGVVADAPRGLAYYPGRGLTPAFDHAFFVAHGSARASERGVRAYTLKPQGAGYAVDESRTVVSAVWATDVTFGPDSRLYVADAVARWPWPKSGRGRIYAVDAAVVSGTGRAQRVDTRKLLNSGMSEDPTKELAERLGHPDQRVRQAAQFELAQRGEASLPVFQQIAETTTMPRLARLHALWGAGQLADRVPAALNHLPALLRDHDAEVRAQAARLIGDHVRFESYRFLTAALQDPDPRVALFAAQSLGKLKRTEAIPFLLELLRRNDDQDAVLRHAIVIALARLGADPALEKTVRDSSRAVRLGGLLAYRRLGDARVASFLEDFDPTIVREAALAINDTGIAAGMPALAALLEQAPLDDEPVIFRALNAHFRLGQPENAQALATFASRSYVPAGLRAEALNRLAQWASPPPLDRITGLHRPVEPRDAGIARQALVAFLGEMSGKAPEAVQVASIRAVAALAVPGTGHALWDVVFQDAHPVAARVAALQALEQLRDPRLEVATQHASRSEKAELRMAALPILSRLDPAVSLPMLKRMAERGSPVDQPAIFRLVATIPDPRANELLLEALERLEQGTLPVEAQDELIDAALARAHPPLAAKVQQIERAWQVSADPLAAHRGAWQGGDPTQGRLVFERHPLLGCIQCHDDGRLVNRSASAAGNEPRPATARELLDAIVHPNAQVNPGAQRTALTLQSGENLAGVVFHEDEGALQLRLRDGTTSTMARDQIVRRITFRCEMAKDVGEVLSRGELRDLVAYLRQLQRSDSDGSDRGGVLTPMQHHRGRDQAKAD